MRRITAVLAAALIAAGCATTPTVHPRALENNAFCVQYLSAGDVDRAERHCDLGLEFSPQYSDLWLNKGLIAWRRGQHDKARDAYIKSIRYNNEQAQAYNNLGVIYREVDKKLGQAHDSFQRALKVNPDYTEARYNLALTLWRLGKRPQARKEYETILAVNPNLADPHHDLAIMDFEDGDMDGAIANARAAVERDASFANAWLTLGNAYAEKGKFGEAKDAFTSCLEADPENAACRNNVAIVNRKGRLLDPTLKELKETSEVEATAPSMYRLAQSYKDKNLRLEEERTYKKCLKLDVRYAPCHFGLHEIYADDRKDKDAITACKNFLKFAVADEYPDQVESCEKFLSASDD